MVPTARTRTRWARLLACLAAAIASLAADGAVVVLGGYNLHPREALVDAGSPVTFHVQADEDPMMTHTVVGADGAFRSPPLSAGESWSLVLEEPGVYRYHLDERRSVEGTLVVR